VKKSRLLACSVLACLAFFAPAPSPAADQTALPDFERDGPITIPSAALNDPCLFFRGQAYERGVPAFAIDMLLACEEIDRRRTAGLRLSDRLRATEAMLQTYREAIVAAGNEAFDRRDRAGQAPWLLGLSGEEKYAIAEATGALLVLDSIRNGF
jgi:hypothetical protein